MEHLPAAYLNDVLYQMQTESGGRANAINLTDINAQLGDPSRGLMQVIMATFRMWHWPGTSWNIYDPLANIAAALNYAAHGKGFGSGMGQIGSGHGYAKGGRIPEAVIGFGMQSGDAYQFHKDEWVTPAGRGRGSGPVIVMNGNIMLPEGTSVAAALREVDFRLRVAAQQGWPGMVPGG
jgi:SLT domain-containing protein